MRRALISLSAAVACLTSPLAQAEAPAKEQPAPPQEESRIFGPGGLGTRTSGGREASLQKRADIRKLLVVTGSTEIATQVMDQLMASLRNVAQDLPEEFWTKFREEVKPTELVELLIPVYEKHLTHEDILQMLAFYESPTGQKVIRVLPAITEQSMEVGQAWGARLGEKIMRDILEAQGEASSR